MLTIAVWCLVVLAYLRQGKEFADMAERDYMMTDGQQMPGRMWALIFIAWPVVVLVMLVFARGAK